MAGRTYRYMEKDPLFPFGFGLSYTTFTYSGMTLGSKQIISGAFILVEVTVTNTGKVAAEEVVQLYLKDVEASVAVPIYALKGFQRVALAPGEAKKVSFIITPDQMKMINEKGEGMIEKASFKVYIGGSVPSGRSLELGAAQFAEAEFRVN